MSESAADRQLVMPAVPPAVQALALLFWGAAIGQPVVGVALAGARMIADGRRIRLTVDEPRLMRAVDLTALLLIALFGSFLASAGLPRGLLLAAGWLPAALMPLLLLADSSTTPLRLRHLAFSLRRSTRNDAQLKVNLGAPHFAITLIAAGVLARPTPTFGIGLGVVLAIWLWRIQPTAPAGHRPLQALLAAIVATALGLAMGAGLHRAHMELQDWVVDALSGADDGDPYRRQTRIGDLGQLKLSGRIVWRLEQAPPVKVPLLLRRGVYSQFSNGAWLAQRDSFVPFAGAATTNAPQLRLWGSSQGGRQLIPLPPGPVAIVAPGRLERNPHGIVRIDGAPETFELAIHATQHPVAELAEVPGAADLALSPQQARLLDHLPELAALRDAAPAARVTGLADWFASNFRYSLYLGADKGGAGDIEAFLRHDRRGHCEYFATGTVLLLRALGVPARYVSGFSVQDYSPLEKRFLIRERHAHAWAEAYVDGRWIEIDNTPADWVAVEDDAAPFWRPLADALSFAAHAIAEWRRNGEAGDSLNLALLLALSCLAAWAGRRMWRTRRHGAGRATLPAALSPLQTEFRAIEAEMAQLGLARAAAETPRHWLLRMRREGCSVLDASRLDAVADVVEALYRERYAALA